MPTISPLALKTPLPATPVSANNVSFAQQALNSAAAPLAKIPTSLPKSGRPQFGWAFQETLDGLVRDTLGVYAPKLVTVRSKPQLVEETTLEALEDVAFYFTVPLAGHYVFAPLVRKFHQLANLSPEALGTGVRGLKNVSRELIAGKTGVLFPALALAAGFEYLVYFAKPLSSALLFKIKNFGAVAGLEKGRDHVKRGEDDPVRKAIRVAKITTVATAGLVALGLALPTLIKRFDWAHTLAKGFLKIVDFKPGVKNAFDMSKPILFFTALSGLAAALHASRNKLEQKENGLRIPLVIAYYMVGKELASDWLAKRVENSFVGQGSQGIGRFRLGDKIPLLDKTLFQKNSWLNIGLLKHDAKSLATELASKVQAGELTQAVAQQIQHRFKVVTVGQWVLSAGVFGILLNLVAYAFTRQRFQQDHASAAQKSGKSPTDLIQPDQAAQLRQAAQLLQERVANAQGHSPQFLRVYPTAASTPWGFQPQQQAFVTSFVPSSYGFQPVANPFAVAPAATNYTQKI